MVGLATSKSEENLIKNQSRIFSLYQEFERIVEDPRVLAVIVRRICPLDRCVITVTFDNNYFRYTETSGDTFPDSDPL